MSTEIPIPALPDPVETKAQFTYEFPHILLGVGRDAHGCVARQIRQGESRQVEYTTRIEYSEEPVPEEPLFTIKGANLINFGGHLISVLNDEFNLGNDLQLPASSPSASEYLQLIGQPVLLRFECRRDLALSKRREDLGGTPAYRTTRTTITLI